MTTYLTDVSNFDSGVYQLATTDPVQGGAGGVSNMPLQNLANRTRWLYDQLNAVLTGATIPTGLAPIQSPTFTGTPSAPTPALGDNTTKLATTAFVQATVNGRLSLNVAGSANVTLTAVQAGYGILTLTGALTASISVIVPTASGQWIVENNTTGSYTLTVKTAAGTGIAVTQGAQTTLFCDGTNVQSTVTDFPSIAITGTPTAPSPGQYDNSTRIATTAWVNSRGMAPTAQTTISASQAISASNSGSILYLTTSGITVTLPTVASMSGGTFIFSNVSGGNVTLALQSGDSLDQTETTLYPYDNMMIVSDGSKTWHRIFHTNSRAPVFPGMVTAATPAQFDSSTSVATTAFVHTARGSLNGHNSAQTSQTLTAANVGNLFFFYGSTASQTLTLPALSAVDDGSAIWFINDSSVSVTVAAPGSDLIDAPTMAGAATGSASVVMAPGDRAGFVSLGSTNGSWRLTNMLLANQFNSPALTGNPTAPTPALYDNDTSIATTAYVQANTMSLGLVIPGSVDLNTMTTAGVYIQSTNANAASGTNYPVAQAGMLEVYQPPSSTAFTFQRYTIYTTATPTVYVRTYYSAVWGAWRQVAFTDNTALTGVPTAPTASQFNSSTQIATTAFVQNALGNYQSRQYVTAATTLNQSESGAWVQCGGTGPYTITLPAPTTINTVLTISHVATGTVTISTPTASIYNQGVATSTLALVNSDTIKLCSDGSNWNVLAFYTKSPTFVGVPAAPTAAVSTNTTQLATTAFVLGQAATAAPLINGTAAVGTSLLYARQDHAHPTDTTRAPLASPTFTGSPSSVTPAQFDSDTSIATTAFVQSAIGSRSGVTALSAATALTTANAGELIVFTAAVAATLPAASSFPTGVQFAFMSRSTGASVVFNASDTVFMGAQSITGSIALNAGDTLIVVSNGSTSWRIEGGSISLTAAAVMSGANWTTPAQFDASTKFATTAFVKNAGVSFASQIVVNASTTLTAATAAGRVVTIGNSGTNSVITLPTAVSCPAGTVIHINSEATGVKVVSSGSDIISQTLSGSPVAMGVNDTLVLVSDGGTVWLAVGGSAQLAGAAAFGASLGSAGYQKLPTGLIIQWGTAVSNASGIATVTFPIAFPNVFSMAVSNYIANGSSMGGVSTVSNNWTKTTLQINAFYGSTAAAIANANIYWIAIGF